MKPGFTIHHSMIAFAKPTSIVVANYSPDNEIEHYVTDTRVEVLREDKTRSDVGVWHIKYKTHA